MVCPYMYMKRSQAESTKMCLTAIRENFGQGRYHRKFCIEVEVLSSIQCAQRTEGPEFSKTSQQKERERKKPIK